MSKIIALNRKARYNYIIEDVMEAGMVLSGSEVKSLRNNRSNIEESYVDCQKAELYLVNAHIAPYEKSAVINEHQPRHPRKLLMHKKQISKITGLIERKGYTIVPLKMYFNDRGIAKITLATAKGKKLHDKRQSEKQKDWNMQKARLLKKHAFEK